MLPPSCQWRHSDDGSRLYYHFGCIAAVRLDGGFWVQGWGFDRLHGRAASTAQGVRFVTRMVEVRGLPWKRKSTRATTRRLHKSCTDPRNDEGKNRV